VTRRPFIASSSNARLKAVRRLARGRARELVVVEGAQALRRALEARADVREVFAAPALHLGGDDARLVREAELRGARVVEVSPAAFEAVAGRIRPDGVLALVARPPLTLAQLSPPGDAFVVVASGIERPGNLGTIVRTACGVGAHALLVADPCTDVFHRDVVRGSVATVFSIPIAVTTTDHAIAWLRGRRARILATTPGGPTPYWRVPYDGGVAVVLGGERSGLSDTWLQTADERIAIPLPGPADSLNVAVAAGVVLCEAARRR